MRDTMTEPIKKTVADKEYVFRILSAIEYGNIIDASSTQQESNRKLLAESTGIPLKEISDLDFPIFSRLLLEFHQIHAPKDIAELAKDLRKSTT